MHSGIETGFLLDRQWHLMRSEPESSKRPALLLLGRVLADAGISYAIIGGVGLLETDPAAAAELTEGETAILSRLP
ncbi:MAG TPA: hypothetical protein VMW75_09925 [Thermoanaerobaculia bacterium]|nr:hypothetical protein [Thermoanaerobaculia bacterium]